MKYAARRYRCQCQSSQARSLLNFACPLALYPRGKVEVVSNNMKCFNDYGRRETAEIFRGFGLADPGNCKYWDIVGIGNIGHGHIAQCSYFAAMPCSHHCVYPVPKYDGEICKGEKNCGKYLFLMSRAQCGDGC